MITEYFQDRFIHVLQVWLSQAFPWAPGVLSLVPWKSRRWFSPSGSSELGTLAIPSVSDAQITWEGTCPSWDCSMFGPQCPHRSSVSLKVWFLVIYLAFSSCCKRCLAMTYHIFHGREILQAVLKTSSWCRMSLPTAYLPGSISHIIFLCQQLGAHGLWVGFPQKEGVVCVLPSGLGAYSLRGCLLAVCHRPQRTRAVLCLAAAQPPSTTWVLEPPQSVLALRKECPSCLCFSISVGVIPSSWNSWNVVTMVRLHRDF